MSEYQYYEFQTVDRPLTHEQMAELRSISSRATITPTRFQNSYNFGDFRGEPLDLLTDYFDAHVYLANWGSYTLLLRFPRATVSLETLKQYAVDALSDYESGLTIHERGERIIVDISYSEEDGGGGWMDESDAAAWLPSLVQLRTDIQHGDLRALYLGWLSGATANMLEFASTDEDELAEDDIERLEALEPPVPPGLGELTAPLQTLTRFLEIDEGLLAAAAKASPALTSAGLTDADIAGGIAEWPPEDKDALLARVAAGDPTVGIEIRGRLRAERAATSAPASSAAPRRTVRDLLLAGPERAGEFRLANEAAAKRARQEYLDALAGREEQTWAHVQALIQQKQARPYDDAVSLLADLAELADWRQRRAAFNERLAALRDLHRQKPSFLDRLKKKGLG